MSEQQKSVWPVIMLDDARAVVAFLSALGFEPAMMIWDGDTLEHGEMSWPEGGGVMFGSAGRNDSALGSMPSGSSVIYVVTDHPDEIHERAVAANGDIVMAPTDQDYGSRDFIVRGPDGNLWSFGTYRGAPPD